MRNETKEKYGWLAALVVGRILAVGRVVYAVSKTIFKILSNRT